VQTLARRAGLPTPRLFLIDSDQPNAFATGRDPAHAALAITTGLLASLNRQELAGVIAHELGHVRNRDILIMTMTATIAGAISMVTQIGLLFGGGRDDDGRDDGGLGIVSDLMLMILAPLAATLVQMAVSRTREFEADRIGAEICGHPAWLADALLHIHHGAGEIPNPMADSHPATAHLFIMNPLHGGALVALFSTHPPTEERVRRLRLMAGAPASHGSVPSAGSRPRPGPWS
jgi:heat shock protein HtpX